jgi:hypothetical protein
MTAASPYEDLEPERWLNLLVLSVVYYAVRAKLERLYDMGTQTKSVEAVLDQLMLAAQEASADVAAEEDADAVLRKALNAWDANLDSALSRKSLKPDARKLLTEVRDLVSHCVAHDPFQALFAAIEDKAQAVYGEGWRPAVLSVAHIGRHPRLAQTSTDPYTVTALTRWPPIAVKAVVVELRIFCDEFGPAAFAVLPMLLTHECICHVPARQDKAKNDSLFAEGFMDWAACRFLQEWAAALDPELASAARMHAERLSEILTQRNNSKEAAARRQGHGAAEALLSWFEWKCALPPSEAGSRVARLAVELNQVDSSIRLKDHFVTILEQPFPPSLDELLRNWVAGEIDTGKLFAEALSSFPIDARLS